MLNQTIIRIPLIIILIMLVILLVSFIRQDIENKRSFIIDVDKLQSPEDLKKEINTEEISSNNKGRSKTKKNRKQK